MVLKSSLKQSKPLNELAAGKFNALKKGSTNTEEIKKIQQALIDCGFDLGSFGADGDFGRATEGAVKQFQTHYKPTHTTHKSYQFGDIDGIVGKNTILALDEALVDKWAYDVRTYKLSTAGLSLLKEIETLRLLPYDDQTGKVISTHVEGATIGYGYLIPLNEWELYKDGIKEKEAESLFMQKLPPFEKSVQEKLTVTVTQQQFDALVLLCYNIGAGNFNTSSVLKLVNGGIAPAYGNDIDKAWLAWNKSQGKVMQGLINRRKCELDIYHNGVYKKW
ncbi:glycoside hydrolase family protein [Vibrio sp. Of14-4]|uniref:glycoside hydrolase family protein n=1 Tax=Vibrio sp. Of14-4 TaxID=2724878 RepID=UPI0023B7F7A1|nr:glycoside hydrolase family protein [Vibrio sp. Of14-4]